MEAKYSFWLHFQDSEGVQALSSIEFEDTNEGKRTGLFRGQTVPRGTHWSSFAWSKATRALAVLLVRRVVFASDSLAAVLSGERGSLASSLDYAITKQPIWLMDLFGSDTLGRSRFIRLIDIVNPSRKRPGPVTITLRADKVSSSAVHIFINDNPGTVDSLQALLRNLEGTEQTATLETESTEFSQSRSKDSSKAQISADWTTRINSLPNLPPLSILEGYLAELSSRESSIVVLEDDCAGIQLTQGIPSILDSSNENISWLLDTIDSSKIGFITHPSRGHDERTAEQLFYKTAHRVAKVAKQKNFPLVWATRFDSCLRGHNLAEVSAVKRAHAEAGLPPFALEVYAPSFYQQGRLTVDGVQLIKNLDTFSLISDTEYAKMPGFEYASSSVLDIVTRSGTPGPSYLLDCNSLRSLAPEMLVAKLTKLPLGTRIVIDSVDERDSIVAAYVLYLLEKKGVKIIYRSAPSLLLSLIGRSPAPAASIEELNLNKQKLSGPGLIIGGSLSRLTKLQLRVVSEREDIALVPVDSLQLKQARAAHILAASNRASSLMKKGFTALITTRLWEDSSTTYPSPQERDLVLDSLAEIVRNIADIPSWLLLKGSDTCLHVLRWGVKANRLQSVGRCSEGGTLSRMVHVGSVWEQKPIVLFPGNVGDEFGVLGVVETLSGDAFSAPKAPI